MESISQPWTGSRADCITAMARHKEAKVLRGYVTCACRRVDIGYIGRAMGS
jgi:hypothetical protein